MAVHFQHLGHWGGRIIKYQTILCCDKQDPTYQTASSQTNKTMMKPCLFENGKVCKPGVAGWRCWGRKRWMRLSEGRGEISHEEHSYRSRVRPVSLEKRHVKRKWLWRQRREWRRKQGWQITHIILFWFDWLFFFIPVKLNLLHKLL